MAHVPCVIGTSILLIGAPSALLAQGPPAPVSGEAAAPVPPAVASRDEAGDVTIRAVRVSSPIRVDGRLDEPDYETTLAITDFVQQEPNEGQPATERTESWVFFDDDNIYVSARCWDTHPERMVANEMRRDTNQLRQNDTFAVLLDTYHDRRNGFLFYANPIGGFADSQITDENPPNVDWNTIWDVKTGRFNGGWTIEMAIPFKSLRYGPGRDQTWGINLRRVVRWKNEWAHLTQIPRALTTFRGILKVSSAATLVGLQAPSAGQNLELKPYAISSMSTDNTVKPSVVNDLAARIGGDAKYGITSNLTADFTVRTDFAQVEVDEQQVNLTRFNLFFPEKRDFFLEGQGIFAFAGRQSSGLNAGVGDTPYLFFSRRIGLDAGRSIPIQAGGRLTGKAGKFSLGALNVETADDPAVNVNAANFTVLRAKRDILRRSSIGAMITHRSALVGRAGSNDGYGADATFSFFQNLRMDTYLARTRTGGKNGGDTSYRGLFDYNADKYGVQAERLDVGRNFNPEIGFVRRLDMRRNYGMLRYSPRPKGIQHVRRLTFQGSLNYTTNTTNRLDTRQAVLQVQTEFTNSDLAMVSFTPQFERLVVPFAITPGVRIPAGGYDYHTTHVEYQAGQQRKMSGTLLFENGSFYDGTRTSVGASTARVQITPQMSLEPSLQIDWVDLREGRFTAKVVRTRATYTLTPRIYVSGIVQYNSTNTSVGSNLRFRWEYRPGSEIFVVYTDDYDTVDKAGVDALRNRAFVIKVNRLLRF
ncbi:MAG TPA: DUF5916 domain-containing protein [Vicinamibacterales bacterium]|nr:DUF5916 domain-containing protein [Vicinamibacterales bacterium]